MKPGRLIGVLIIFSLFAGIADASFLDEEAGISAYTKANTEINLNNSKNAFRTIERQTDDYIVGSVEITGLPVTEDAHVYVSKEGWVLAYYMKDQPASKVVQWSNYNGGAITTTTLADAVSKVASAAGVSYSGLKYYDFKYPGANRLMMIASWNTGSYDFKIPSTFGLNENSFSFRGSYCESSHSIDGNNPPTFGSFKYIEYGYYSTILSSDVFHIINYGTCGGTGHNTVLVYREP